MSIIHQPLFRWLCALAWTALVTLTLLQSSSQPVIGPAAPPGEPPLEREILLLIGHVIAFGVLTWLWWWAWSLYYNAQTALLLAVLIALVLGTSTEILQALVPDRATSWFDLVTNWIITLLTAWRIQRRVR
jgi:VanZ family protein